MKASKAKQRSVSCNAFSPKFNQMYLKVGLIKRGFGLIKCFFLLQE